MKHHFFMILALLCVSSLCFADPNKLDIQELLALSGSHQMVDMTKTQLNGVAQGPIQQALQGKTLTPELTKIVQDASERASKAINEGLTWEKVEPIFVEVYQSTLTQEEVEGIVAFYKTPAGKAMVEKMPQLMQLSGQKMQQQLGPLMQELQKIQQETIQQIQAELAVGF